MRYESNIVRPLTSSFLPGPDGRTVSRYIGAVLAIVLVTALRLSLGRLLGDKAEFLLYLPAVMAASWWGGIGPALVAMAGGAAVATFLFATPRFVFAITQWEDSLQLLLFVISGLMIAVASEQQRQSARQARESRDKLAERQQEVQSLNDRLQRAVRETNHRVKNNLQMVGAMIDLEADRRGNAVSDDGIARLRGYICSLADLHDLLTRQRRTDTDIEAVSSESVLRPLISTLSSILRHPIELQVEPVLFSVKQATALGLVVNEAVSNARKHGGSYVRVTLKRIKSNFELRIEDDGPGFPPGFDPRTASHTGLDLVDTVVRCDLGGTLEFRNRPDRGACVAIQFPETLALEIAEPQNCTENRSTYDS